MNRWSTLLLAAVAAAAWAGADGDSTSLLARVQAKVRDSARKIPRYVCRQDIRRQADIPIKRHANGCGTLAELLPQAPSGLEGFSEVVSAPQGFRLAVADRAHLDVMIAEGTELLSWPGGGRFQTVDPADLLGGGFAGTGDFAGFVADVFLQPGATFESLGECPRAGCVRYAYDVPVTVSRYILKTAIDRVAVGFHGMLEVDPQTADLLSMTVIPTEIPKQLRGSCDLRTRMTYTRAAFNSSQFIIPEEVSKEFLAIDGSYFTNTIGYTGCRQYTAESSLTFGTDAPNDSESRPAAAPALPVPGTQLELRLRSSIDSDVNWGGDRVEATLTHAVKTSKGGTIPAGTVVRGHLAEVEKVFSPYRGVRLTIRFDTIVLNGAPVALAMKPEGKQDLRGRGVFQFAKPRVVLDRRFTSKWRVR